MAKVIVFGPTGNIGSVAAITAQKNGAKVALAMRDTKKSIRGLSEEAEKTGGFERVEADLTKPDTITNAVKSTGATRAFMYLAFGGGPPGMKGAVEALKAGGIEHVVFLSSSTIQGEAKDVPQEEIIPWLHAQVELSLGDVFGTENYTSIRPGRFATNLVRDKDGINAGEVEVFCPDNLMDGITHSDMGEVSGKVLADGTQNGQRKVYLYGPQIISQGDAYKEVGRAVGREVKIVSVSEEKGREQWSGHGIPPPIVNYLIEALKRPKEYEVTEENPLFNEGHENVKLYTGHASTGLYDWAKSNKDLFVS